MTPITLTSLPDEVLEMIFLQAFELPPECFATVNDSLRWLCLSRRIHNVALVALYKSIFLPNDMYWLQKFVTAVKRAPFLAHHTEYLYLQDLSLEMDKLVKLTPRVQMLFVEANYDGSSIVEAVSSLPSLHTLTLLGWNGNYSHEWHALDLVRCRSAPCLSRLRLVPQPQSKAAMTPVRSLAAFSVPVACSAWGQYSVPRVTQFETFSKFAVFHRANDGIN